MASLSTTAKLKIPPTGPSPTANLNVVSAPDWVDTSELSIITLTPWSRHTFTRYAWYPVESPERETKTKFRAPR
ncbi:unnamed protein product, partial [Allacma fusca]